MLPKNHSNRAHLNEEDDVSLSPRKRCRVVAPANREASNGSNGAANTSAASANTSAASANTSAASANTSATSASSTFSPEAVLYSPPTSWTLYPPATAATSTLSPHAARFYPRSFAAAAPPPPPPPPQPNFQENLVPIISPADLLAATVLSHDAHLAITAAFQLMKGPISLSTAASVAFDRAFGNSDTEILIDLSSENLSDSDVVVSDLATSFANVATNSATSADDIVADFSNLAASSNLSSNSAASASSQHNVAADRHRDFSSVAASTRRAHGVLSSSAYAEATKLCPQAAAAVAAAMSLSNQSRAQPATQATLFSERAAAGIKAAFDRLNGRPSISRPAQVLPPLTADPESVKFRKLFVGSLTRRVNETFLFNYFSGFGQVVSANIMRTHPSGRSLRYGSVVYATSAMADNAINHRPHVLDYSSAKVRRFVRSDAPRGIWRSWITRRILVGGMRKQKIIQEDLVRYFSQFGCIKKCEIPRDENGESKGFAFVLFEDFDSVDKALLFEFHIICGYSMYIDKALEFIGD